VELRDIAVLTRVWKPLEAYSEVLPALGVNAMHSGGGNLLETREAKDCFAALSFLADSSDNLALAAVLRSPHAAWSDHALARVARATPKEGSWWETLKANPPEEGVEVVLALDALVHARRKFAPSRLLQMLDSLTGYTAVIRNLPGGVRREADYRAFLQLLRQLEPGSDLFTVTRRVRRLVQADAAVPRPALQATDAVTLMTIHRAKGLEWPVVILADLDYRPGNTTPSLLLDPGLGVAMKVEGEDGQSVEPFVYKLLKRQQAAREAQELKRVLYVGLTRTRDHLYLSATDSKGGALDALLPCLDAAACAINGVPHTSETSAYPQHAEPQAHAVRDVGDLWRREVANLGKAAAFVEPKFLPKEQRVVPDGWRDAISLFEMSEEHRWLPLLEALQAAGVPAPHLDGCLTFLEDDPGTTVLLVWHDVRLVEEGTLRRPGVANVVLVTAADPHASTRNVLRHLGLAA
jgi:ATP-dependent helicase/nuclease subunit A